MRRFLCLFAFLLITNTCIYGLGSEEFGIDNRTASHVLSASTLTLYLEHCFFMSSQDAWFIVTGVILTKELIDMLQYNSSYNIGDVFEWQAGFALAHIRFQF